MLRLCFLIFYAIQILAGNSATAKSIPIVLNKSLLAANKNDFNAISKNAYQDIRFETKKSKKFIWIISSEKIKIKQLFINEKLSLLKVLYKTNRGTHSFGYKKSNDGKLLLVENRYRPNGIFFQQNSCGFNTSQMDNQEFSRQIKNLYGDCAVSKLNTNCESVLTKNDYQNVQNSIDRIYNLKISGPYISNEFVECLGGNENTMDVIPEFVGSLINKKNDSGALNLICSIEDDQSKFKNGDCTVGSYDSGTKTFKVVFNKRCEGHYDPSLVKSLFHESWHPDMEESEIQYLTELCPTQKNKPTPASLTETTPTSNTFADSTKPKAPLPDFALNSTANKTGEESTTPVPKELAESSFNPSGRPPKLSLGGGTPDAMLAASMAVTAPVLSYFSKTVGAAVASAYAATPPPAPTWRLPASTFENTNLEPPPATGSSPQRQMASAPNSAPVKNTMDGSGQGVDGNSVARDLSGNSRAVLSNPTDSSSASGTNPDRAEVSSKEQKKSQPPRSDTEQAKINLELQRITEFANYDQAIRYLQNNKSRLKKLGIVVITRSGSYGAKPGAASVFIQEKNGRFRQVNE